MKYERSICLFQQIKSTLSDHKLAIISWSSSDLVALRCCPIKKRFSPQEYQHWLMASVLGGTSGLVMIGRMTNKDVMIVVR